MLLLMQDNIIHIHMNEIMKEVLMITWKCVYWHNIHRSQGSRHHTTRLKCYTHKIWLCVQPWVKAQSHQECITIMKTILASASLDHNDLLITSVHLSPVAWNNQALCFYSSSAGKKVFIVWFSFAGTKHLVTIFF